MNNLNCQTNFNCELFFNRVPTFEKRDISTRTLSINQHVSRSKKQINVDNIYYLKDPKIWKLPCFAPFDHTFYIMLKQKLKSELAIIGYAFDI